MKHTLMKLKITIGKISEFITVSLKICYFTIWAIINLIENLLPQNENMKNYKQHFNESEKSRRNKLKIVPFIGDCFIGNLPPKKKG